MPEYWFICWKTEKYELCVIFQNFNTNTSLLLSDEVFLMSSVLYKCQFRKCMPWEEMAGHVEIYFTRNVRKNLTYYCYESMA